MFARLRIVGFFLVCFIAGFIVYENFFASQNGKKVQTVLLARGDLQDSLTISGTIAASEKVILRFQTAGKLAWVGVKEGDYVKKYQAIASLDQKELQKQLTKYLNLYLKSRNEFEQTINDDYKDRLFTNTVRRTFENVQLDLNNTVLDVEIKNIALELATIWSPIEGFVVRAVNPYPGVQIALTTQAEFEIVNPKTVYFEALADQTEVVDIKEGMPATLTLDAYLSEPLTGKVERVSFTPKTGETGTVYAVKFALEDDNSSYQYKIGMTGDLTFVTERKHDVLYLPLKFVKSENGKKYVRVAENGKISKVEVTIGMESDNFVEITSGLFEGATVY